MLSALMCSSQGGGGELEHPDPPRVMAVTPAPGAGWLHNPCNPHCALNSSFSSHPQLLPELCLLGAFPTHYVFM